jgi:2-keto-4-pentenoate hydratase/2-oxohepta-3-ene-1,7-dioic acid hydratase in catechol pathway
VIGTGDEVLPFTELTRQLDYEAELAVVIGKPGRGIRPEDAWDHVWGYTIVNDVTARDLQQKHRQWFIGKSMDTFCPMAPWIVTADEVDATNLSVKCWINGELRQDATTSDLIFDIPTIIATLSAGMTLQPGDVIATGTPAGVGIGFSPPRFLVPGDLMKIEISGIGTLENRIAG